MNDHASLELEEVRLIVEQLGKGVQAFHHLEMLHQN